MKSWVVRVRNQQGVALPLALFVLVSLSAFVLAFLSMGGMEPQISRNLTDTAGARYLADAGVEWAFDRLMLNPNWSGLLAANGGTMANKMTLPGLTATFGTFTVTIRNDNQPNDNQITGQALDTGNNVTDNNQAVIVTATGTLPNGMSRQIQVVVSRIPLNIRGAVNLPGVGPSVTMGVNAEINGNDTIPGTTTPGSCAPSYGITVAPGNEAAVEATLNPQQLPKIKGRPQNPAQPSEGTNTVAGDASLTSQAVTEFVNAVKGRAHVSLVSTPTSPLAYNNGVIGSTCATNWSSPTCWGTPSNPKVIYVKAQTPNVNAPFAPASVYVEDVTGAGILIVEDGTLFLKGAPGWQGIIIVTGKNVGLKICCGQTHDVWGGIIVNETLAPDAPGNTDFFGWQHSNFSYSCQAIRNALSTRVTTRVMSWREL